jgi:hypothetical protein
MTVQIADEHAQVHRLVSVVRMAKALEDVLPRSNLLLCVFFLWEKEFTAKDILRIISCLRWEVFIA